MDLPRTCNRHGDVWRRDEPRPRMELSRCHYGLDDHLQPHCYRTPLPTGPLAAKRLHIQEEKRNQKSYFPQRGNAQGDASRRGVLGIIALLIPITRKRDINTICRILLNPTNSFVPIERERREQCIVWSIPRRRE